MSTPVPASGKLFEEFIFGLEQMQNNINIILILHYNNFPNIVVYLANFPNLKGPMAPS